MAGTNETERRASAPNTNAVANAANTNKIPPALPIQMRQNNVKQVFSPW